MRKLSRRAVRSKKPAPNGENPGAREGKLGSSSGETTSKKAKQERTLTTGEIGLLQTTHARSWILGARQELIHEGADGRETAKPPAQVERKEEGRKGNVRGKQGEHFVGMGSAKGARRRTGGSQSSKRRSTANVTRCCCMRVRSGASLGERSAERQG